jgi:hypothetical protein
MNDALAVTVSFGFASDGDVYFCSQFHIIPMRGIRNQAHCACICGQDTGIAYCCICIVR